MSSRPFCTTDWGKTVTETPALENCLKERPYFPMKYFEEIKDVTGGEMLIES